MCVARFRDRKIRKEEKQRAETEMALKGNFLIDQSWKQQSGTDDKAQLCSSLLHKVTVYLPPQPPAVGGSLWSDGCRAELTAKPGGSGCFPGMDLTSLALRMKTKGEGTEILWLPFHRGELIAALSRLSARQGGFISSGIVRYPEKHV